MSLIDSDGLMRVEVNGAIHRRRAQMLVLGRDANDLPMNEFKPELRQGEVLLETIGSSIPTIMRTGL